MVNLTTDIQCPYCKINFEVNVDLEDNDIEDIKDETSMDVDFDEMQCPNCENFFAMHGKVNKNEDDNFELVIESID